MLTADQRGNQSLFARDKITRLAALKMQPHVLRAAGLYRGLAAGIASMNTDRDRKSYEQRERDIRLYGRIADLCDRAARLRIHTLPSKQSRRPEVADLNQQVLDQVHQALYVARISLEPCTGIFLAANFLDEFSIYREEWDEALRAERFGPCPSVAEFFQAA